VNSLQRQPSTGAATTAPTLPNMFSPNTLGANMWEALPNYTQLTVSGYSGGGFAVGCGHLRAGYVQRQPPTNCRTTSRISAADTSSRSASTAARTSSFRQQTAGETGSSQFNGGTSGDGMADLLLGRFSGLTDGEVISDYIRLTAIAAYAQDAFHVTPRLTINYGVRWEPEVPAI